MEPPLGGDVHELLATERRLEEMLAEAHRLAERIITEARAEATASHDLAAAELSRRGHDVVAEVERAEKAIVETAAKRVAAVDRALAERQDELAAFVIERLITDVLDGSGR